MSQTSEKLQSSGHIQLKLLRGLGYQQPIIHIGEYQHPPLPEGCSHYQHAFCENQWCSQETGNDGIPQQTKVVTVLQQNGKMEIGIPEIYGYQPSILRQERNNGLQRDHAELLVWDILAEVT